MCRRFVWKYYKLPKICRHTQVDSLMASYECCTIEGSYSRPLAGRLFHRLGFVELTYRNSEIQAEQVGTMGGSNWRAVGKARVRRLLDSLHRRIGAILQPERGHVAYLRRYYCIISLIRWSGINPFVDIPVWSYAYDGNKSATFCPLYSFIQLYIMNENVTCAKSYQKNHETTPLLHMFVNLKVIWVKLCIL